MARPMSPLDDLPRNASPVTSRSSWTATAAGPCGAGSSACKGHQQGAVTVRNVVTECARLRKHHGGPDFLTLYSFSVENWKRPIDEVSFLMTMYIEYLQKERQTMMENNIRFRQIGRLENLPEPVLEEMNRTLEETKDNDGLTLVLALNYGSRTEITDAVREIASKVQRQGAPPRRDRRADDLRPPLHRRHARPGPAHPHRRRDARQQLSSMADQLRGAVRQRRAVAGFRRG